MLENSKATREALQAQLEKRPQTNTFKKTTRTSSKEENEMHQQLWEEGLDWEEVPGELKFEGTLKEVIENLERAVQATHEAQGVFSTFLWGSRLVHAGVEYALQNPDGWKTKRWLTETTQRLYAAEPEERLQIVHYLAEFTQSFASLTRFIDQPHRHAWHWQCSFPGNINGLAEKISASGYEPEIIVGTAYGAIRPGLLLAELLGTPLEIIRYSRGKRRDHAPLLGPGEQEALSELLHGKRVLAFDEDVGTGLSLYTLRNFLQPLSGDIRTATVRENWDTSLKSKGYDPEFKIDFHEQYIW